MFLVLCLLPISLSLLIFAAHILRHGSVALALAGLLIPAVLFTFRHPRARRTLQFLLLLAALEWVRTLFNLVQERNLTGQSWTVAAIILMSVIVFTFISALIFELPPLRQRFRPQSSANDPEADLEVESAAE